MNDLEIFESMGIKNMGIVGKKPNLNKLKDIFLQIIKYDVTLEKYKPIKLNECSDKWITYFYEVEHSPKVICDDELEAYLIFISSAFIREVIDEDDLGYCFDDEDANDD